jgi:hypothetical protein
MLSEIFNSSPLWLSDACVKYITVSITLSVTRAGLRKC